jgi:3-deoxy-D-manno-octulosonate 8-phosphate phosphatase (KDO 8-P phosphatase)
MDPLFLKLYGGQLHDKVAQSAAQIKLLICDVDGVFSDGRIYLGNNGEEFKAFNTRDGYGVKALQKAGIDVAIITGRNSPLVEQRMRSLTVKHIYMGKENKVAAYQELLDKLSLTPEQVAFIGDDSPDLKVMQQVGLSISVPDGHPYVKMKADHITTLNGGFGAVREVCDLLLIAQHHFDEFDGSSS